MRVPGEGQEGQLVLVWFDLRTFEVTVDWSWGDESDEHKTYKEAFSRYKCFEGIEKAPRGGFDPELLRFESASGDGKEIGVRVGREFYDLLPFSVIRGAVCSYAVRPGVAGVPVSTGQLVAVYVSKEFSPKCPARMVGGRLLIDELREAVPDVPESGEVAEAVPVHVSDRKHGKAVARIRAVVPEPGRGHAPVGRKLPVAYIPEEMFARGSFDGLCLGEIETYRIVRTFAKKAGRGSDFYYNEVGILQLCGLLERRVADMLVRRRDERRREIERIRFGDWSVRQYVTGLLERGLVERVKKGRPMSAEFGAGYVSKYKVAMSEQQRFKMVIERKKRGRDKKS